MHVAIGTELTSTVLAPFPAAGILRLGPHRLDIGALRLLDAPETHRLTLKAVQVLLSLARQRGETVTRDHLLDTVWRGTSPTPEVVTQSIKELRRVLGDNTDIPRFIETVPKVGYRLICDAEFEPVIAAAGAEATIQEPTTPPRRAARQRIDRSIAFGLAGGGILMLIGLLFTSTPGARAPWMDQRGWNADQVRRVTTSPLMEALPRISDDGNQVLYLAADLAPAASFPYMHTKLRGLGGSRTLDIATPHEAWDRSASWAPGGNEIAIVRADADTCRILGMPTLGGAERLLGTCVNDRPPQFDWSPDGLYLIGSDFNAPEVGRSIISRQPIGGGTIEALDYPHLDGEVDLAPRYSPDRKWIAFRRGLLPYSDLYLMPAEPPRSLRRLTSLGSRLAGFDWTRDGTSIVFSSDHAGGPALYTVDINNLVIEPLGIEPARSPSLARHADIGVYSIPDDFYQFAMLASDGSVPVRSVATSTTSDREADLSPEGNRVAFITRRSERDQVWLHDLRTQDAFPLTDMEEGVPRFPDWRADGKALAFVLRGAGPGAAIEINLDSRHQKRLSPAHLDVHYVTYSEDGHVYAVALQDGEHGLFELMPDGSAMLLEPGVSFARAGNAETGLVFNYLHRSGVFRLGAKGEPAQKIADVPNFRYEMPWSLSGSRAFYVLPEFPTCRVEEVDLRNGARRVVAEVKLGLAIVAISSDLKGEQLLTWVSMAEGSDIGSFRLRPQRSVDQLIAANLSR